MQKIYLLFVLLCGHGFQVIVAQQDPTTDSLQHILEIQKNDTGKINALNILAKYLIKKYEIPDAKKYTKEALSLAEKIKFVQGLREANINSGGIYNAEANNNMGKGNYSKALENYLSALRVYEKYEHKNGIAGVSSNIGRFYWIQKNYVEAIRYYNVSLKYFRELNDKYNVGEMYNKIGLLYENRGLYPEALKYYYEAIKLFEEAGVKWALINQYFNIGFLYDDQKNYTEALKNFAIALKVSEEIGSKNGIAASHSNMGDIYTKQGNYSQALKSYLLALELYKEEEDQEGMALSYISLATVYIDSKDFINANKNLKYGLDIAKNEDLLYSIKVSYELMAKSDSLAGNWESALSNYKNYVIYRDSLEGDELKKKILKTQMQYEFDKKEDSLKYDRALIDAKLNQQILLSRQQHQDLLLKEKEVLLLNNEKQLKDLKIQKDSAEASEHKAEADKRQSQLVLANKEKTIQAIETKKQKQAKNYLLAGIALLVILSIFVYWNYHTRQKLKFQTLRNKIADDLHDDIGSTLSSISIFSQMALEESKEVKPMLQTIGESSRKMLDAMADIVWTIKPENDQFEKIIMRMRSFAYELLGAKQIEFRFVADKNIADIQLSMEARRNLYLIFKEATNNMVKYAEANKAMFSIKEEQGKLVMMIQDNGKGFDSNKETQGNGLKNMKKRADEMGAVLHIDSIPGNGTTIKLEMAV